MAAFTRTHHSSSEHVSYLFFLFGYIFIMFSRFSRIRNVDVLFAMRGWGLVETTTQRALLVGKGGQSSERVRAIELLYKDD